MILTAHHPFRHSFSNAISIINDWLEDRLKAIEIPVQNIKRQRELAWLGLKCHEQVSFFWQISKRYNSMSSVIFLTCIKSSANLAKALYVIGTAARRPAGQLRIGSVTVILSEGFIRGEWSLHDFFAWTCEYQGRMDEDFLLFYHHSDQIKCFLQTVKVPAYDMAALERYIGNIKIPPERLLVRAVNVQSIRIMMHAFIQDNSIDPECRYQALTSNSESCQVQLDIRRGIHRLADLQIRQIIMLLSAPDISQTIGLEQLNRQCHFAMNLGISLCVAPNVGIEFGRSTDACIFRETLLLGMQWCRLTVSLASLTTLLSLQWGLTATESLMDLVDKETSFLITQSCNCTNINNGIPMEQHMAVREKLNRMGQRLLIACQQAWNEGMGRDGQGHADFEGFVVLATRMEVLKGRIIKYLGSEIGSSLEMLACMSPYGYSPSLQGCSQFSIGLLEELRNKGYELFEPLKPAISLFRGIQTSTGLLKCLRIVDPYDSCSLPSNLQKYQALMYPHLANLEDIVSIGPYIVLITEYCEHGTLASYLDHNKLSGNPTVVRRLMQSVMHGLLFLHSQGIIHGRLYPSNLLLSLPDAITSEPIVKIADYYPIAGRRTVCPENRAFLAPECLAGRKATRQSDVWSIGVLMLYFYKTEEERNWDLLVEKHELFNRPTLQASVYSLLMGNPSIDCIIEACLQVDPAKRPSASHLLRLGILRT